MLPYQSIFNLLGTLVDNEVSLILWPLTSQISLSSALLSRLPFLWFLLLNHVFYSCLPFHHWNLDFGVRQTWVIVQVLAALAPCSLSLPFLPPLFSPLSKAPQQTSHMVITFLGPQQSFPFILVLCVPLVCAQSLSRVQLFVTPWTEARQTPLSMEFSMLEYWSGLLFPSPGESS